MLYFTSPPPKQARACNFDFPEIFSGNMLTQVGKPGGFYQKKTAKKENFLNKNMTKLPKSYNKRACPGQNDVKNKQHQSWFTI